MPKYNNDAGSDAALAYYAGATAMHLCSTLGATPTRAQVITASLADVVIDAGDFTGPADGDTSGRKITVAAQNGVAIDANGTANHVALIDGTNVRLVTTCASQVVSIGNTANIGAFKHEIADVT